MDNSSYSYIAIIIMAIADLAPYCTSIHVYTSSKTKLKTNVVSKMLNKNTLGVKKVRGQEEAAF